MSGAILLSGGIDSIALTYWVRPRLAITIDYGQLGAEAEINAAAAVTDALAIKHDIVRIDCRAIGGGKMLDGTSLSIGLSSSPEWWPYRNQLLVTLGAARCLLSGCSRLAIGSVKTDRQHKDGSPEFAKAISDLLFMQEGGLVLEAPAIELSSEELVAESRVPMSILAWAHSCHASNIPCGYCRGCNKYREVMATPQCSS